ILSQTIQESGPGTVRPSESLRLTCTVSGFELTSYHVVWIKQPLGKVLEWIAIVWADGTPATQKLLLWEATISLSISRLEVYLQINGMEDEDSATYYC
ncbi:hypothetical protein XENTR_v10001951, partial [Xenopus tropicalis]